MLHFGKEREKKRRTKSNPKVFSPKKTGMPQENISRKLRRRTIYTASAQATEFMYGKICA